MKENGAGKLVNFAKPGPLKLPSTFCAPWAIKTQAKASRSGSGVHDADVEIILLNIAGRSFHRSEPERPLKILRNGRGKGKGERGKGGKGERIRGKGQKTSGGNAVVFNPLPFSPVLSCVDQQSSGDGWFRLRADKPVNQLSVFEDEHRGNALDLKLRGGALVVIHIQLCDAIASV